MNILVIEDVEPLRNILIRHIEKIQKPVLITGTGDGEEAIKLIENIKFDIIFLDIELPGISGLEVLEKIMQIAPGTEVIPTTADNGTKIVESAFKMGVKRFFTKPLPYELITEYIASLV